MNRSKGGTYFSISAIEKLSSCLISFPIYSPMFNQQSSCVTYHNLTLLQVKHGAENMIQSLTSGHSRDKKLLAEAQQMLADSKAKIEFLKMRILKEKQSKQNRMNDSSSNGDSQNSKGMNFTPEARKQLHIVRHFWISFMASSSIKIRKSTYLRILRMETKGIYMLFLK